MPFPTQNLFWANGKSTLIVIIFTSPNAEAVSLKERAMLEIEREREKAEYEIKKQAVDLAVELSIKALDQKIDENTHRQLIGDFIAKVGM